ncbi:MAG TPA: hypothetical protein VK196_07255 [Magnetospirillum sp.]|nr:hypothetical protein [Magnetospirillum sp.]
MMGAPHADVVAVPQINENGTRVDGHATTDGPVTPWAAAEDVRKAALGQLEQTLAALGGQAAAAST